MRPGTQSGALLAEALAALALAALLAAGVGAMVESGAQVQRAAARMDEARSAAETVHARLALVSFTRLPAVFRARPGDLRAELDTGDGSAPVDWGVLCAALPQGRIRARLEGVAAGGAPCAIGAGLALRVSVHVFWREPARDRAIGLADVRL